jgi:hypothetical protein
LLPKNIQRYRRGVALTDTVITGFDFNPLNVELNPIRHLLALAGAHHFVHVSRVRVKRTYGFRFCKLLCAYVLDKKKCCESQVYTTKDISLFSLMLMSIKVHNY